MRFIAHAFSPIRKIRNGVISFVVGTRISSAIRKQSNTCTNKKICELSKVGIAKFFAETSKLFARLGKP